MRTKPTDFNFEQFLTPITLGLRPSISSCDFSLFLRCQLPGHPNRNTLMTLRTIGGCRRAKKQPRPGKKDDLHQKPVAAVGSHACRKKLNANAARVASASDGSVSWYGLPIPLNLICEPYAVASANFVISQDDWSPTWSRVVYP
jgi:hypothetical protein